MTHPTRTSFCVGLFVGQHSNMVYNMINNQCIAVQISSVAGQPAPVAIETCKANSSDLPALRHTRKPAKIA
jgi:hypothetical protein